MYSRPILVRSRAWRESSRAHGVFRIGARVVLRHVGCDMAAAASGIPRSVLVLRVRGAVMVAFPVRGDDARVNLAELRQGFTRFAWLGGSRPRGHRRDRRRRLGPRRPGIDATKAAPTCRPTTGNTLELGRVLYTKYAYPFELAAVLLLVAIVAAIFTHDAPPSRAQGAEHFPCQWLCGVKTRADRQDGGREALMIRLRTC